MNVVAPPPVAGDPPRGWILYDAACPFCCWVVRLTRCVFVRRGYAFAPLQTPGLQPWLGLNRRNLLAEVRILHPDGTVIGGGAVLLELAGSVWWLRPLAMVGRLPFMRQLIEMGYRWVSRHRNLIARGLRLSC